MRVAKPTVAAFGNGDALADMGEVGKHRLTIFFVDLRPDRYLEHHVLAIGAGAVLAHPVTAALCLEMLLVAVVDQGVEAVDRLDNHIAALSAVATIGAAELDEFLAPERYAAVPARTRRNVDLGFIEEFHGLRVYRIARPFAKRSSGINPGQGRSSPRAANLQGDRT